MSNFGSTNLYHPRALVSLPVPCDSKEAFEHVSLCLISVGSSRAGP